VSDEEKKEGFQAAIAHYNKSLLALKMMFDQNNEVKCIDNDALAA